MAADRTPNELADAIAEFLATEGWGWQRQADDLRDAAALLDGQPQDRPATCPTCGSDDPDYCNTDGERHRFGSVISERCCPDSWHVGGSGDTR